MNAKGVGRKTTQFIGLCIAICMLLGVRVTQADLVGAGPDEAKKIIIEHDKYRKGVVLVKYKIGADDNARIDASQGMRNLRRRGHVQYEQLVPRVQGERHDTDRWRLVNLPGGVAVEEAKRVFAGDAEVEAVEPDYALTFDYRPDDPDFSRLWNLERVQAPLAWDRQRGSSHVIVAVVDTGVDYYHEDLTAAMWVNEREKPDNGIDDDSNGYVDDYYGYDFRNDDGRPSDDYGHGAHVAGTIAAMANNGTMVAGIAGNVRVMAVKFIGDTGTGWVSDAVSSIDYAVRMGAQVINASWGSPDYSFLLYDAIQRAAAKNVLFVASAGNSSNDSDRIPLFPAAYDLDNIVSVAATDDQDRLAYFSNFGAKTVDLAAPGVYVVSTVPRSGCTGVYWTGWPLGMCNPTGSVIASGTSMAAPHVAGAAALLLSRYPGLSTANTKRTLLEKATPIAELAGKTVSGGRLDADAVVRATFASPYDAMITPDLRQIATQGAATYQVPIRFASVNGFSRSLTLSTTTNDTRLTASLSQSTLTLAANGSATVQLTVKTTSSLPRGYFPVSVTARDSSGRRLGAQVMVAHQAPDFDLTLDASQSEFIVGESALRTITITSVNGFSGDVTLKTTTLPTGITAVFSATRLTVPRDGSVQATLQLSTTASTPVGDFKAYVQATGGNSQHAQKHGMRTWSNGVDLIVYDIESPEKKLNLGATYPIEVYILNQGGTQAPHASTYGVYLSSDSALTKSDRLLATGYAAPLAKGKQADGGVLNVPIPVDTPPGHYFLGAIADIDNNTQETNENNNVSKLIEVDVLSGVDLTLANLKSSRTILSTGESITVTDLLRNDGINRTRLVAGRPIVVRYYLSADATITTSDRAIATRTWATDLAAGAILDNTMDIVIPSDGMTSGKYYLGAIVDPDNVIAENNDSNNAILGPQLTLTHNVDLSFSRVTVPARQTLWTFLKVDAELSNAGSSPVAGVTYSFYLSRDTSLDSSDWRVGYPQIATIVPANGRQIAGGGDWIGAPLRAGRYYLIAIVDEERRISETNETNNRMIKTIDIVEDLDTAVENVKLSTTRFTKNETVVIDAELVNKSTSPTGYTDISVYRSPRAQLDADAVKLTSTTRQDLASGQRLPFSISTSFGSVSAGRYYMLVVAKTPHDVNAANDVVAIAVDFLN